MPASKTKTVKTPQYRESILSNAIKTVSGNDNGPDWANGAPQYKIEKIRAYVGKGGKSYKKADSYNK